MAENETDERFYDFRDAVFSDLDDAAEMLSRDHELINVRNRMGETVMHFLAVENCGDEVAWLIDRGADVDSQNKFGKTPLMEAASLGRIDMFKLLVSRGANFRYVSSDGKSVFSAAATSDQVEVLKYLIKLLEDGEDINPFFTNVDAEIALKYNPRCAPVLIQHGLRKRWDTK